MNHKNILENYRVFYEEHHDKRIIKKIIELYNLNINDDNFDAFELKFCSNSVIIYDKNKDIKTIIEFEEELYKIIVQKKDYKIINMFTNSKEIFRKIAVFNVNNNEVLLLDEIIDNLVKRSISVTSKKDIDFVNGNYEYEYLKIPEKSLISNYEYIENSKKNKSTRKVITIGTNLYYYLSKSYQDILRMDNKYEQLEIAFSKEAPNTIITGRVRTDNELLEDIIYEQYPIIKIINHSLESIISIKIYKQENKIIISIDIINDIYNNLHYDFNINSNTTNSFSEEDIELIIETLQKESIEYDLTKIIKELNILSETIKTNGNNQSFDFSTSIRLYPDFNRQAFDIYMNINKYLEHIKNKQNQLLQKKL